MNTRKLEDDYLNELADISAQISQEELILNEGLWDRFVSKTAGAVDTAKAMGGNAKAMWSNFKNRNDPNYQKQGVKDVSGVYGNKKFATLLKQYLKKIISIAEDLVKFEKSIPPAPQDQQGQQPTDPNNPQDPSGNGGQAKALPAGKTPLQLTNGDNDQNQNGQQAQLPPSGNQKALPAPQQQGQLQAPQQQGQLPAPQQQGQLPAPKQPLQLGWNGNDDDDQNKQNESLSTFEKMYRLVMEYTVDDDGTIDMEQGKDFTVNDNGQQQNQGQQQQQNQAQNQGQPQQQQQQQGQEQQGQEQNQQQPNKLAQIKKDTNDLIQSVRTALGGFWGAFPDIVQPYADRLKAIGCEPIQVRQVNQNEQQNFANNQDGNEVPQNNNAQ